MTDEEKKEQVIAGIADLLRTMPFTVEYKVKKRPSGIKVICEMTKEEMAEFMENLMKKHKEHGTSEVEADDQG